MRRSNVSGFPAGTGRGNLRPARRMDAAFPRHSADQGLQGRSPPENQRRWTRQMDPDPHGCRRRAGDPVPARTPPPSSTKAWTGIFFSTRPAADARADRRALNRRTSGGADLEGDGLGLPRKAFLEDRSEGDGSSKPAPSQPDGALKPDDMDPRRRGERKELNPAHVGDIGADRPQQGRRRTRRTPVSPGITGACLQASAEDPVDRVHATGGVNPADGQQARPTGTSDNAEERPAEPEIKVDHRLRA